MGPEQSNNASTRFTGYTFIAIDISNVPYIVYADGQYDGKANVKKRNGSVWGVVGTAGFSDGIVRQFSGSDGNISIAIDKNNVP